MTFSVLLIHRLHQKPTKATPLGPLPFPQQTSTHTYTSTRTRLVRQKVTLRSSSIRLGLPSSHERSEKPTKKADGIEEVRVKKKEEHQQDRTIIVKKRVTREAYTSTFCALGSPPFVSSLPPVPINSIKGSTFSARKTKRGRREEETQWHCNIDCTVSLPMGSLPWSS